MQGVRIHSLDLPFVKISQFYIKLDKKLIVSIKDVETITTIKEQKQNLNVNDYISYLPIINNLFKSISIQNLTINKNTIKLLFKDNTFYIDTPEFTLDSTLSPKDDATIFDIKHFYLKKYDVRLKGELTATISKYKFLFKGKYEVSNLAGKIEFLVNNDELFYRLDSVALDSIEPFMEHLNTFITIEPNINNWVYKFITATKYKINNLEGKFNLKTLEYYPNLMSAEADVENISVSFHQDVPPALIPKAKIMLKNDELHFKAPIATYMNKTFQNPNVFIYRLLSEDSGIIVELKNANALLDKEVQKILKAFKLNIPLLQNKSTNNSYLLLDVDFDPASVERYKGVFELKDSYAKLSGLDIFSKSGKIYMDNEFITFKNVHMRHKELFDINFSGKLNTKTKQFFGDSYFKNIKLDFQNTTLFDIKDETSPIKFEILDTGVSIYVKALDTLMKFEENNNSFLIEDISYIRKYSKIFQDLNISQAKTKVETQEFKNYKATLELKHLKTPLYLNKKNIQNIDVEILSNGKTLQANAKDYNISASYNDNLQITIKDLDIKTDLINSDSTQSIDQKINFTGYNSTIEDINKNYKILNDTFKLQIDGKNLYFKSKYKDSLLELRKRKEAFYLESEKLF